MARKPFAWLGVAFATVALIAAPGLRADEAPTPIRIAYRAPAECPREAAFSSQVLKRTARVRLAHGDESGARALTVSLASSPPGYSGRLEVEGRDGRVFDRNVTGDTCDEVVSALALVTALALDPNASVKPIVETEPAAGSPPPASPQAPVMQTQPAPVLAPIDDRAGASREPERAPSPWHFAFGADATARSGVTPDWVGVLSIFAELDVATPELWHPLVRVAFERSASDSIDTDDGAASFRSTLGSLEGCPVRWSSSTLWTAPCLRVEAGVLEGEGSDIVPARTERRAWFALGALGRAEWSFFEPFFADFAAGIVLPLTRDRFFFQPDTTLHRAPALGVLGRVGLGLRFP